MRFLILIGATLLAGCDALLSSSSVEVESAPPEQPRPAEKGEKGEIVVIIGGNPTRWEALRPLLVEAGGGDVISEYVLDARIADELRSRNMEVTEEDTRNEKAIMLARLSPDPDQAVRLLERRRDRFNLGPRRFDAFLRRYAGLRKLVAGEVVVNDVLVRQAYEQRYTEQTVCRMVMVENLRQAAEVKRRAEAGESFTDLAIELSSDPSRNQGGLLPPISPHDPTFPTAITGTAPKLAVGEVSDPIALEGGFAILRCERKIPADPLPFEQVADEVRRDVRLGLERSLMDRKARVLMDEAEVTVLNADLDREYKRRRQGVAEPE